MNKIDSVFQNNSKKALIGYITVGYPDIETTVKAATILDTNGCDIIELGIPFSDPMADGATIQRASFQALQNGTTIESCLETASKLSKTIKAPLVFMSYYNPIYNMGLEKFCKACFACGVSGLIIPDLPPEESSDIQELAGKSDIDMIYLLPPTSTEERIKFVAEKSRGFIYLVSLTGVTGTRDAVSADLVKFVHNVKEKTEKPLCVGFGISTPEQSGFVADIADGVIIGSKLIQLIEDDPSMNKLGDFITSVRKTMDG